MQTETFENEPNKKDRRSFVQQISRLVENKFRRRFPRLFYITASILLPLLFLTLLSMFCGHFLAVFERGGELEANNASIAKTESEFQTLKQNVHLVRNTYTECLKNFTANSSSGLVNISELKLSMDTCTAQNVAESRNLMDSLTLNSTMEFMNPSNFYLTFDWNRDCAPHPERDNVFLQPYRVVQAWYSSFNETLRENLSSGKNQSEGLTDAFARADGMNNCTVNSLGAAVTWFTIMT